MTKLVNSGLGAGGWAESRFVDTTLESAKGAFDQMFAQSGFTDTKLRIRFDSAEAPAPPV